MPNPSGVHDMKRFKGTDGKELAITVLYPDGFAITSRISEPEVFAFGG
jgi:hypothetical protein